MNRQNELFESVVHASFKTVSKFVYFKTAQLADAEDIVQNVYASYYRYVIVTNKSIENPVAYLLELAKNELASYYKDKAITQENTMEAEVDLLDNFPSDTDLALETIDKFSVEAIYDQVKTLSPLDQKIIAGRFRYELTFAEIAKQIDLSENTIKTRYYRAIQTLKDKLDKK
jgi:RNA polymerase sigma-70 factor, ECF subfamily